MLIEFTVGNYLSFKEKVTLSMEATSITEHPENVFVTSDGRYRLLKSVAIYGANGSGKSNLVTALGTLDKLLKNNNKLNSTDELDVVPFKLNTTTESKPSIFEIVFLVEKTKYRYGFEADKNKIFSEWLFESNKASEKALFVRTNDQIKVFTKFKEGKGLEGRTGNNRFFLSICDQFNGEISKKIIRWFTADFRQISALNHDIFSQLNSLVISDEYFKPKASQIFKKMNLGFQDLIIKSNNENINLKIEFTEELIKESFFKNKIFEAQTIHNKYNEKNEIVDTVLFDVLKEESKGTNKIINCSIFLLLCLHSYNCLAIDELDASLHPLLTLAITKLFNSTENNSFNSQLIFSTHDTNLLSRGDFRRDQIYFVEKDNYEVSHLYSLAEFKEEGGKKIRKDRSFEQDYIQGRYGAIPFIGDFSKLFENGKK